MFTNITHHDNFLMCVLTGVQKYNRFKSLSSTLIKLNAPPPLRSYIWITSRLRIKLKKRIINASPSTKQNNTNKQEKTDYLKQESKSLKTIIPLTFPTTCTTQQHQIIPFPPTQVLTTAHLFLQQEIGHLIIRMSCLHNLTTA